MSSGILYRQSYKWVNPCRILWKLPGWELEMTDPNYCRIGEVRPVLRRR